MGKLWILVATGLLMCGGAAGACDSQLFDVDGNGEGDALTDGLLVLRYLFGFRGGSLATGAVALNCERCDPEDIEGYLEEALLEFDADGNGTVDALTDGLLILRRLFDFRGDALTAGAVALDCGRCDAGEIEGYLAYLACPADPVAGNLRYVPADTFVQGSPAGEPCRADNETQFDHMLTHSLAVMETQVSRQMWANLRAKQPTLPADPTDTEFGAGSDNPVQSVTWHEAVLFANLLSVERELTPVYYVDAALTQPVTTSNYQTNDVYAARDVSGYRLPTEGEWEYFARAGTAGPFSVDEPNYSAETCGAASCTAGVLPDLESAAWFCANWGGQTQPVGLKAANPWGLKDVHGNVWEWVWDRWGDYPGGIREDYAGPATGDYRVLRGGAWFLEAQYLRSARRQFLVPQSRWDGIGFRLVRSVM
jgi:formylglycine-generating enzyme required for sulfatase activity